MQKKWKGKKKKKKIERKWRKIFFLFIEKKRKSEEKKERIRRKLCSCDRKDWRERHCYVIMRHSSRTSAPSASFHHAPCTACMQAFFSLTVSRTDRRKNHSTLRCSFSLTPTTNQPHTPVPPWLQWAPILLPFYCVSKQKIGSGPQVQGPCLAWV